jgi:hypothetical protein
VGPALLRRRRELTRQKIIPVMGASSGSFALVLRNRFTSMQTYTPWRSASRPTVAYFCYWDFSPDGRVSAMGHVWTVPGCQEMDFSGVALEN